MQNFLLVLTFGKGLHTSANTLVSDHVPLVNVSDVIVFDGHVDVHDREITGHHERFYRFSEDLLPV